MRNLTPVGDVYKAVPTSFFQAPNRHNKLWEMRFEFPFNLIGKLTMAFLLGQLMRDTNPGTQVGAQNKDFGTVLQTDLTIALVPSVAHGRGGMMLSKYRELISAFIQSCLL